MPGDETDVSCYGQIGECPAQAGGLQQIWSASNGGATNWPQSAVANLSSNNPDHVYGSSTIWSALEQNDQNKGLIAQIGWMHDTTSYNEWVFAQITDGNGNFSPIHDFYVTPSGTNNYAAYRLPNGTFSLEWSGGIWSPGSGYNWGSDTVAVAGEVTGYDPNEKDGDHFPGNRTTPATASNVQWEDQYGNQHSASLCYFAGNKASSCNGLDYIPPYGHLYNWGSSHFEVWDDRCW